ncbi:MAG: bifunctional [glutamine synthetase] adenylyltransferase/[glutamine synthetase]-adenylyl-L-tyrosine phosphorylase [Parvibaculales bacterium]
MTVNPNPPGTQPPHDAARALAFFTDCLEVWTAGLADSEQAQAVRVLQAHRDFFLSLFDASPFLTRIIRTRPGLLAEMSEDFSALDKAVETLTTDLGAALAGCGSEAEVMTCLRRARQKVAFLVACGDVAQGWPVHKVTGLLSDFADACVSASVAFLLRQAQASGDVLEGADLDASGLAVLALGKHGAAELNYSSDIDLVAFFEPDSLPLRPGLEDQVFFVVLVQKLVHLLQSPTADGFAFRVDLRLRPDPGATKIAVSLPAAAAYYETMGQNWERAAYIKARPVAGDREAGARFLETIRPFIWRRNLDFAAIADVHAMKRQIHAVRGHAQIAVAGHNVKLGRGGIREIEFFVQTQQLIAGGRDESLRGIRTCAVLPALAEAGWIEPAAGQELVNAYEFLRRVEHRLQMMDDEQTHTIPDQPDKLSRFVRFMGYRTEDDFGLALTQVLACVQGHYARLFESEQDLTVLSGSLVFTGVQDDPETLETLAKMGFSNTTGISGQIRSWHTGRYPAMRSARARELLTRLVPDILDNLSQTPDPDFAFARFHDFLTSLPMGVQPFSLFKANPKLLSLIADIVGTAPRLSGLLARQPIMLDSLLDKAGSDVGRDGEKGLTTALSAGIDTASDFETQLDMMRIWAREQSFHISTRLLGGSIPPAAAAAGYSAIATACVRAGVDIVARDMERRHGVVEGGSWAVIGLGKFGSREMSASSDLDLIMICDAPDFAGVSDGSVPLAADVYYARLARRLIAVLTAPTSEGALFEVDTRLRPSGNAGALISKLSSFAAYQKDDAWTWEHMALTRARIIAGPEALHKRLDGLLDDTLMRRRDSSRVLADVREMRARMAKSNTGSQMWDLKHAPGGLVDMEFIAQGLYLCHAHDSKVLRPGSPLALFEALRDMNVMSCEDERLLRESWAFQSGLNQILKLCLTGLPKDGFSKALQNLLCQTVNLPSFDMVEAELTGHRRNVRGLYEAYLG